MGPNVRVTTRLDIELDSALARVDAASAQASVLLIGLLSIAIAVELLASRLVMERRGVVLSQWRSRGATLPSIGLAAAAESIPLAALGGFVGATAAHVLAHGQTPWAWLLPPLVVAAVAPPVLSMWVAAKREVRSSTSVARRRGASAARLRRLGAEVLLVVVAAGSLVTLRLRGVGSSAGAVWSDVVVLAAPVLVALALAVMMVRAQSRVLSAARALATGRRGVVPLLAAARMRASGVATVALATAGVIAAVASSLAMTVSHAQVGAAWDSVGADVAITANAQAGLPEAIAALDGTSGLTVATATLVTGAQVIGPKIDERVDIAVVDADAMARLLAETPRNDAAALRSLTSAPGKDGAVPMLVAGAGRSWKGATLRWGDNSVPVTSVGAAPQLPRQLSTGRIVVVVASVALAAHLEPRRAADSGVGSRRRCCVAGRCDCCRESLGGHDRRDSGGLAQRAQRRPRDARARLAVRGSVRRRSHALCARGRPRGRVRF